VRPRTLSPMVTDDYRSLPKGSVRPVTEKPASCGQKWDKRTDSQMQLRNDLVDVSPASNGGWPSALAPAPERSPCSLAFAGPALDCRCLRVPLPRGPFP